FRARVVETSTPIFQTFAGCCAWTGKQTARNRTPRARRQNFTFGVAGLPSKVCELKNCVQNVLPIAILLFFYSNPKPKLVQLLPESEDLTSHKELLDFLQELILIDRLR